jgi:hypothetical protein
VSTLKPPVACDHVAASAGWFVVYAVEQPNGGIELEREPILGFRMDTFQIEGSRGAPLDRFTSATPILAGGSVSEGTDHVLQNGDTYFSGDQTFRSSEEVIAYFRKRVRNK